MSYIGTEPKDIRSFGRTQFDYTATQGQTAFTGADDDGKVLAFTTGQINVYVNGILMDDSDFTTTGTGTVTLASAANLNDIISIVSFESNIPDNDYVPASGGTFTGAVTASNGLTVDDDGATVLTVDRATSDGTIIDVQKDGSTVGSIGNSGGAMYVSAASTGGLKYTYLNGTNAVTQPCNTTGTTTNGTHDLGTSGARFRDLYLGGGVYLGGTITANYLNDYEEGSWTPVVTAYTGTAPTVTYGTQAGDYVKIGNVVTITFEISIGSISGTNTAYFEVEGQPFSFKVGAPRGAGSFTSNGINFARTDIIALSRLTDTSFGFLSQNDNAGWGWEATNILSNGDAIRGTFTYEVS